MNFGDVFSRQAPPQRNDENQIGAAFARALMPIQLRSA